MGHVVLLSGMAMLAVLAAWTPAPGMSAALAAFVGFAAMATVAVPSMRDRLLAGAEKHRFALAAFAALLVHAALSTLPSTPLRATTLAKAENDVLNLLAIGLAFLAAHGVGVAAGRNRACIGLLAAPVAAMAIILFDRFDGVDDLFGLLPEQGLGQIEASPTGAATLAMFALLAAFTTYDEFSRRPTRDVNPRALARRLAFPGLVLLLCVVLVALSGQVIAMIAAVAGGATMLAALLERRRPGRGPPLHERRLPLLAAGLVTVMAGIAIWGILAGARGASSFAQPDAFGAHLELWRNAPMIGAGRGASDAVGVQVGLPSPTILRMLADTGVLGVSLGAAVLVTLLFTLSQAADRGARPSRASALVAGLLVTAAGLFTLSDVFGAPGSVVVLAAICGAGAAYVDSEATQTRVAPSPRTHVI